jgi:hypothetical protein
MVWGLPVRRIQSIKRSISRMLIEISLAAKAAPHVH